MHTDAITLMQSEPYSSVKHDGCSGMAWACRLLLEWVNFFDAITHNSSIRMHSEVFRHNLSENLLRNASNLIGGNFTM